jgi:hypothetical protein
MEKANYPWAPTEGELDARRERLERVGRIAREWRLSGKKPLSAHTLSSSEKTACCIVSGNESDLRHPVYEFMNLNDWFQTWILKEIGLEALSGRRVGDPIE